MVPQPETHYVKGPEGNIAYQVFGDGPIDLVIVPGWLALSICCGRSPAG